MKKISRILLRIAKITGIAVVSVLILLFLAPWLFPDTVGRQIKKMANQSIKGELNFTSARLSFFTHFPSLTLNLHEVELRGSAPFQRDTLLSADRLGFGINLEKLIFEHEVSINKIYLNNAFIHVMVNEQGQANYNIFSSDSTVKTNSSNDSAASLHLEKIIIKDSRLVYNDKSVPMLILAEHLYYEGTGDLSKSIFDLSSHIRTDSLNFTINNIAYVKRKALDATLLTRINTQTLALIFQNNQVRMNKLNFGFSGKLDFLKNGYAIDCSLSTRDADLYQLITIFPPQHLDWLRKTTVKGVVNFSGTLKGKYIAATGEMPDVSIRLGLRDGFIAYQNAPIPISNLNVITTVEMPSLNPENLHVTIDSLSLRMDKDYVQGSMESRGLREPQIKANADASLNLQNLNQALGISGFNMQGRLLMHLRVSGKYARKIIRTSLRKKDTVIASIPSFDFQCSLKNGLVRYAQVNQPVEHIFLIMQASCPDEDYHHAFFKIDTLHAMALHNFIDGKGTVHGSTDFPMDLHLNLSADLADISKIYPMGSLTLSGQLKAECIALGKYMPDHHLFPKMKATLQLRNGFIQTRYYPHPVEKLNIELHAQDDQGSLNGLQLVIKPASLLFEGKLFQFQGGFRNFDDLEYDMSAQGDLDLGRIYQVFNRRDLGISGNLNVHAHFKGKLSDEKNGRYTALENSGSLDVKDLTIVHELFPKPFVISQGHFRFDQDKMWFERFQAQYGKSDLTLEGYIEHVINFALGKNETLKANFNLKSQNIDLNEFSVNAPAHPGDQETKTAPGDQEAKKAPRDQEAKTARGNQETKTTPGDQEAKTAPGVIMVPANMDLTIKVNVEKIIYHDVQLNQFQGGVNIRNGQLELSETGFQVIGCNVSMKGTYASINPQSAVFSYELQARDFDVHRAYEEIKLFHDLASSAQHASGIISLDYALSGKLNEQMYPVYPSVKGHGTLSVKNVKFNGWKLFNAVSNESGKTELKDPDLSKIDVKSSIKNNLITIEKMKFKTGGFRIRFEGQTSFDNKVNFKMRIGLPPLGIIGIPVHITGTADNPKIKITKTDSDPLEEKNDDTK